MRGKIETMEKYVADEFGQQAASTDIDGIELLREYEGLPEGTNILADRVLTNDDLKKIKILKMRKLAEKAQSKAKTDFKLQGLEIIDDRFNEDQKEDDSDMDSEAGESEISEIEEPQNRVAGKKRGRIGSVEAFHDPINLSDVDSDLSDAENPHGFVTGGLLDTCRKDKLERMAESHVTREEKQERRREIERAKRENKAGGKTNEMKKKNKNLSMVMPKKLTNMRDKYQTLKERIKKLKTSLGKVKQGNIRVHRKAPTR